MLGYYNINDNDNVSVNSTDSLGSFDSLDDPVQDDTLAKEEYLKKAIDNDSGNDDEDQFNLRDIQQKFISILESLGYDPNLTKIFMDKIESMDFGQTVVFILGLCEVSVNQGGTGKNHLGRVSITSTEGLADKCLSVYIFNVHQRLSYGSYGTFIVDYYP